VAFAATLKRLKNAMCAECRGVFLISVIRWLKSSFTVGEREREVNVLWLLKLSIETDTWSSIYPF